MNDATFGVELTFVPDKSPYFISFDDSAKNNLLVNINNFLSPRKRFLAKLDSFGSHGNCIEINFDNDYGNSTWSLGNTESYKILSKTIDNLIADLKERFHLIPYKKIWRNGQEIHYPTGGAHIHYGNSFLSTNADWFKEMDVFMHNLCFDFANRPYIRWLFAQWFDDVNSHTLINPKFYEDDFYKDILSDEKKSYEFFFRNINAINPRFMRDFKRKYHSFEFRMFRMVNSGEEFMGNLNFCHHYFSHLLTLVRSGTKLKLTLKASDFDRFKNLHEAKREMASFFKLIGLEFKNYTAQFEENYVNRMKYGKLV